MQIYKKLTNKKTCQSHIPGAQQKEKKRIQSEEGKNESLMPDAFYNQLRIYIVLRQQSA
jgi:3-mercaptopyruvate sulfurtransferase SseA